MLRLRCPCASCVEEMTGRALLDAESVERDVRAVDQLPVGQYALQFLWSDTHYTGIYTLPDAAGRLHLYRLQRGPGRPPVKAPWCPAADQSAGESVGCGCSGVESAARLPRNASRGDASAWAP